MFDFVRIEARATGSTESVRQEKTSFLKFICVYGWPPGLLHVTERKIDKIRESLKTDYIFCCFPNASVAAAEPEVTAKIKFCMKN